MGPVARHDRDGRRTRNNNFEQENFRSGKIGAVPVFNDTMDPKLYRERIHEWIGFQALCADDSSRKMSFGEQIYAIKSNIRGSANTRVNPIIRMIRRDMEKNAFCNLVDKILDLVDPMNSESRFIRVSTIWKDIIFKRQQSGLTYDEYWREFSNSCMNYSYHHGTAAKQPGVRELLALICLFNSKLRPSDFNNVLHDIIRTQKELNEKYVEGQDDCLMCRLQ